MKASCWFASCVRVNGHHVWTQSSARSLQYTRNRTSTVKSDIDQSDKNSQKWKETQKNGKTWKNQKKIQKQKTIIEIKKTNQMMENFSPKKSKKKKKLRIRRMELFCGTQSFTESWPVRPLSHTHMWHLWRAMDGQTVHTTWENSCAGTQRCVRFVVSCAPPVAYKGIAIACTRKHLGILGFFFTKNIGLPNRPSSKSATIVPRFTMLKMNLKRLPLDTRSTLFSDLAVPCLHYAERTGFWHCNFHVLWTTSAEFFLLLHSRRVAIWTWRIQHIFQEFSCPDLSAFVATKEWSSNAISS